MAYMTYQCLNCGKECRKTNTKVNKYCSNKCQMQYQHKMVHIPAIEAGEKRADSKPLKRYILERDNYSCVECGQGELHNGKPLTLQLDHIDGNSDNNLPENLRTLCPNCHSQTETFGSKGLGNRYKKNTERNNYLRKYKGL